jgi:hypothetical protein
MMGMAKLVVCKGCDGQVSSDAKACPKCGKPVKRGIGIGKILGLVAVILIIGGVVGAADKKKQQRAEVANPTAPPVDVSAAKLASDYKANEVSADEVYKGKVLRVTGVVDSIKKGITNEPYVVLRSDGAFLGVHAHFEQTAGLGGLSPGNQVTIRCIGNNVIMGSPMLKSCVLE